MADDDFEHIRYAKGECGWAKRLKEPVKGDDGKIYKKCFEIANVPLTDGLMLGDVVTLKSQGEDCPRVAKIVRHKYRGKAAIWYDTEEQFHAFCKAAQDAGAPTEGMFGPKDGRRGVVMCCHDEKFDPYAVAKGVGIEEPEENERPR